VLALKHGRRDDLAAALGVRLASLVAVQPWASRVDLVTWVPSHRFRRLRRPWAAAELLARSVAHELALPAQSVLARRGLDRQTGRSRARRLQLPSHSFAARRLERGPGVLVVDDVTTTGATMRRVSAALLAAGAAVVFGAVLAQTPDPRRVI
jgi:predicted amidophosphoribosyltransferase